MGAKIFMLDGSGRWFEPRNAFTGHRTESWRVDLLNSQDVSVGQLEGVTGGSFGFNVNATIRGGGSLSYEGDAIDWNKFRVQPWYQTRAGNDVQEWPLGVFLVATPSTSYDDTGHNISLELYDKTHILDDDKIVATYSVAAGTLVTTAVKNVLAGGGQTRVSIEDSDKTLANAMVWPAGTTRLRIVNDLLESANFFSIWVDGEGVFRASPYEPPGSRSMSWGFADDATSIYSPEFVHDFDTFDVPNRVVVTGQSDGDTPAPVAVASDTGKGPFSYSTRGRWVTRYEEGQDATDPATLNGIAKRLLAEGQQVGSKFSIKHAPVPLNLNDMVGFTRASEGIDVRTTVQEIRYNMNTGELCETVLKEFTS